MGPLTAIAGGLSPVLPNVAQTRFGCCPGFARAAAPISGRRGRRSGGHRRGNAVCRQLCRRQLDLDALRILLLRSRRRRERRAAGNEESAAVAAVAAAAAVAAIRVAAAAAAAVAAVAAVVAPPLHSSRSPAPFLRSASYGAGASARRSHSARPAPDALPLRSVVATRSRRAGRRAVSVGGRRTLNSTPPACRGGRRRLLSGPRAYCPLLPGTEETKTRSVTRGEPVSSRRTIRAALRAPSAPHRLGRARDSVRGSFETGAAASIPVPARDVVSSRRLLRVRTPKSGRAGGHCQRGRSASHCAARHLGSATCIGNPPDPSCNTDRGVLAVRES